MQILKKISHTADGLLFLMDLRRDLLLALSSLIKIVDKHSSSSFILRNNDSENENEKRCIKLELLEKAIKYILIDAYSYSFLQFKRIKWNQDNCSTMEFLMESDSVHPISGWMEMKSRLDESDKRCFALFHPCLPDKPITILYVALREKYPLNIEEIMETRQPFSSKGNDDKDGKSPNWAIFYSVSNSHQGNSIINSHLPLSID